MKIALILAYAAMSAFGTAVILIAERRPLDLRAQIIIAIIGAGALLAAVLIILSARRLLRLLPLPRFVVTLFTLILITLLTQGAFAGAQYAFSGLVGEDQFATTDGIFDLLAAWVDGFAYYFIYGLSLALPIGLPAAFLFSLGFLTLHAQKDTTYKLRSMP